MGAHWPRDKVSGGFSTEHYTLNTNGYWADYHGGHSEAGAAKV